MNLKKQVTSLELAKEAKQASIEIDSYYIWIIPTDDDPIAPDEPFVLPHTEHITASKVKDAYKAPTAAEWLEFLPDDLEIKEKHLYGDSKCLNCGESPYGDSEEEIKNLRLFFRIKRKKNKFIVRHFAKSYPANHTRWEQECEAEKLSDALCKLAIKLKQEDII